VFHPVVQAVARSLRARRDPPPPVVNAMKIDVVRRFAYVVLEHPARREIAESLLVLAIRLDVLGFTKPRDQLLLLVGCGLSAAEITDSLQRHRASEAGAYMLMEKARSTSATPIERLIAEGTDPTATGVGLRSRQSRERNRERIQRAKALRKERTAATAGETQSEVTSPGRRVTPADSSETISARKPRPLGGPRGPGRDGSR
jgi:hypothetical protein